MIEETVIFTLSIRILIPIIAVYHFDRYVGLSRSSRTNVIKFELPAWFNWKFQHIIINHNVIGVQNFNKIYSQVFSPHIFNEHHVTTSAARHILVATSWRQFMLMCVIFIWDICITTKDTLSKFSLTFKGSLFRNLTSLQPINE